MKVERKEGLNEGRKEGWKEAPSSHTLSCFPLETSVGVYLEGMKEGRKDGRTDKRKDRRTGKDGRTGMEGQRRKK